MLGPETGWILAGLAGSGEFAEQHSTIGKNYTRKMMAEKFLTREQTNYIQGRLKMLGDNTVTLAARLRLPWSTVAGAINGNRANPQARQAIADFLGEPVEKLFGGSQVINLSHQDEVSHG